MHFHTNKRDLLAVLASAAAISVRDSEQPQLASVLLSAAGSKLAVTATNLAVFLVGQVDAEIREVGQLAVSARQLHEAVKALSGERVRGRLVKDAFLQLAAGRDSYDLPIVPADGYPTAPRSDGLQLAPVQAGLLTALLARALPHASEDEERAGLCGVLFEAAPGLARAVASDGHRMAIAESRDNEAWGFRLHDSFADPGLVLPREGVDEILRLLKGSKEIVELGADDAKGWVFLRRRLDTLAVRLVGAQPMPWREIVKRCSTDRSAYVEKAALVAALKRALVVASGLTRALHLVFTRGTLTIEAETLDYGSARTTLDADYDDTKFGITANGRYLLEMLKSIDTALVWLGMGAADGPMLLRPCLGSGRPDESFLGIVMPHRADEEEKPDDEPAEEKPKRSKKSKKGDEPKAEPAA